MVQLFMIALVLFLVFLLLLYPVCSVLFSYTMSKSYSRNLLLL